MTGWLARIGIVVLLALLVGGAYGYFLLTTYEEPAVDPRWAVAGSRDIPRGAVTVRWTGTSTLVFSDGETTWLTDGWFSRPGPLELILKEFEPDLAAIDAGLARNDLESAAAVFPMHSHYDHAMDAPAVADRTGAVLLGSESTANIGRGWGLRKDQIRVVLDREPVALGSFVLTPIESRHFEFPDPTMRARALDDPVIAEPLVPPAGAFDYRLGKAYVLHVWHPLGTWLIVASAGFVEGALDGVEADLVFLGTGGLGTQTRDYRETYWRETVERTAPARVIPIHWDSLTGPIEGPFTGPVRAAGFLGGGRDEELAFLKQKEADDPERRFLTLPRYDEVVLFAPSSVESKGPDGRASSAATGVGPGSSPPESTRSSRSGSGAAGLTGPATNAPSYTPREAAHVRESYWRPRFEQDSPLRELESEVAEKAISKGLISPVLLEARADAAVQNLAGLPADERQRAHADAVREAAADAAIGDYLARRKFGHADQRGIDMWHTMRMSVDEQFYADTLEKIAAGQ